MTHPRLSLRSALAAACLIAATSPLPALGFDAFLARFSEIKPPAALDGVAAYRQGVGPIPIEEFTAFVLAPGRALAASRPALRSLDEWAGRIGDYRGYIGHPSDDETYRLSFRPIGRWKAGGNQVVALYCDAEHDWVDGGEGWSCGYLLSFTASGKLIDGFEYDRSKDYPPLLASGGAPDLERAYLSVDGAGRIVAFDEYGLYDLAGEVWTWEIGLGPDGIFKEAPRKRQFLLSLVYAEPGDPAGRLYVYQTEGRARGDPVQLAWRAAKERGTFWALAEAGIPDSGMVKAIDDAGAVLSVEFSPDGKGASLVGADGAAHSLEIEYGPGASGESASMSGIMVLGDLYARSSATWTYLFAESSFPAAPTNEATRFAVRSFVVGTTAEGSEGSGDDTVALGSLAQRGEYYLCNANAAFEARSLRDFSRMRFDAGFLARAFGVTGLDKPIASLPIGTRIGGMNDGSEHWRADLTAEAKLSVLNQEIKAPAGSRIDFFVGGEIESASFPAAVRIRVGASEASAYYVKLNASYPQGLAEIGLAAPFPTTIAGKKVELTDRLYFDESGVLQSGRLAADADFPVGGRTFAFRGGYDAGRPEAGLVSFYPSGELRSGTLAKGAQLLTAQASLSLVEGDAPSFGRGGIVRSIKPIGITRLAIGGAKAAVKLKEIDFEPDGSVSPRSLPEELRSATGKAVISNLMATCSDARVRVRAEPSLESTTLGYLGEGDRLLVLDKSSYPMRIDNDEEYWYRIRRVADGLSGWSYGLFLTLEDQEPRG